MQDLGPCVLWEGYVRPDGYGQKGRCFLAHRVAYQEARGPIPQGLTIDHLCSVKLCVNVDHLEAVTLQENIRRAHLRDGKKVCPHGPNTPRYTSKKGWPADCIRCFSDYNRRRPPLTQEVRERNNRRVRERYHRLKREALGA